VSSLAQGEYNLNYLATSRSSGRRVVLRISTGTQEIATGDEQILYEANALRLLTPLHLAPALFHVDASRAELPHGLLVEEYLPGVPLDYARDAHIRAAARTLAALHTFRPQDDSFLARLERPLSTGLTLGADMLAHYRAAPEASPSVLRVFDAVESALRRLASQEDALFPSHLRGIVHTDVQAHNFIVSPDSDESMRLVDWEKPLVDDPTYDLAHFLAPTTTRWKCGVDLSPHQQTLFLSAYAAAAEAHRPGFTHNLSERLTLRRPFVHWRATTWCAMAWIEYRRPDRAIKNADTAARIEEYLQPAFLESLFSPILS
jgi:thiamine kinase-like enzyme